MSKVNLVIDIGNTNCKLALFNEESLAEKEIFKELSSAAIEEFINGYTVHDAIICAVGRFHGNLASINIKNKILLDQNTPLPIRNNYATPSSLGYDRIASVIGASLMISNREILCIDAGSCITYDLLNKDKEYSGGSISPGITLRFRSLEAFTENLPLVELKKTNNLPLTGSTTTDSIISGVFYGIISELNGIINLYKEKYPDVAVVLTGGNADLFESYIKNEIFAFPDSVLHGLNAILEYNKLQ